MFEQAFVGSKLVADPVSSPSHPAISIGIKNGNIDRSLIDALPAVRSAGSLQPRAGSGFREMENSHFIEVTCALGKLAAVAKCQVFVHFNHSSALQ